MEQRLSSSASTQPPGARFFGWFTEGVRAAVLLPPRWERLHVFALTIPALVGILWAVQAGLWRGWYAGPVDFSPAGLLADWLPLLVLFGMCHALFLRAVKNGTARVSGAALLGGVAAVQMSTFMIVMLVVGMVFARMPEWQMGHAWWWFLAGLIGLHFLALSVLLSRATGQTVLAVGAALVMVVVMSVNSAYSQTPLWIERHEPDATAASADAEPARLQLTQSVMERQSELLTERLDALLPQRPGIVDLYTLTFAPYAYEDVFRRESAMVAGVMRERFDAQGRTLELVNSLDTLEQWPWATLLNLRRAIGRVAEQMDPEEDVLFIHLTSHGAREGELAAGFWPLRVETVTPVLLRILLNEAGIKYRVISISACYSGSWVEPLVDENTLIMTAADADNTSYGCGRLSELTFFGRAMYDEQLRHETRSFETAHAAARSVIRQREVVAGKDDGYSNPQIEIGPGIREPLDALVQRLERGTEALEH